MAIGVVALASIAVSFTPIFAVRSIAIVGAEQVAAERIESAISDQYGRPFPFVNEDEVRDALVDFPLIETFQLEAKPPNDLIVRVVERSPIGVVNDGENLSVVDGAGVSLRSVDQRPDGLPRIAASGGPSGAGFEAASAVLRSLPGELRQRVLLVEARTRDDVTLTLDGDRTVAWGSAEDSTLKARVLEALQVNFPDAGGYDVSSPDVPLTFE